MFQKVFIFVTVVLTSSCVAVKFPSEIKVSVGMPENITEENIAKLIDKIPNKISKKDVKVYVAIPKKKGPQVREDVMIGPHIQ